MASDIESLEKEILNRILMVKTSIEILWFGSEAQENDREQKGRFWRQVFLAHAASARSDLNLNRI